MNKRRIVELVETLYKDIVGYNLSFEGRKKLGYHDSSYTYGEVQPEPFINILEAARPRDGEVLYDLGAGTGKAVIVAALAYDLEAAVGIEYLKDLHDTSVGVVNSLKTLLATTYKDLSFRTRIEFVHADFLSHPFGDADIIFTHSTCFHDGMMNMLAQKFEALKKGARIMTVSKQLYAPFVTQLGNRDYEFNWGQATVYTYIKNS